MNKKVKIALLLALAVTGSLWAQTNRDYVAIGDIYLKNGTIVKPENYSKNGIGVVCYVDETGQHGWITYYKHAAEMAWSTSDYHTTGVRSYRHVRVLGDNSQSLIKDIDGASNTAEIVNESDYNATNYPACAYVKSLVEGEGWYLPSAGQLSFMYAYMPVLNKSLIRITNANCIMSTGSDEIAFPNICYWSSNEYDYNYAWYISEEGALRIALKSSSANELTRPIYVRAMRNF